MYYRRGRRCQLVVNTMAACCTLILLYKKLWIDKYDCIAQSAATAHCDEHILGKLPGTVSALSEETLFVTEN